MVEPERQVEGVEGKTLAVISEGLYLLNLLFPLLPLIALAWLWLRHRGSAGRLLFNHLRQAFVGAVIATLLFTMANLLIIFLGGYRSLHALVIFELYYIICVPLLLIPGLLGLIKAMSGQTYRFPLIGRVDV
ncbi:MAG: hypothetical protein N0C81_06025 [Candidatus Thiodiazotropha lotti]|uniref:DUF4870 domain-containing protein n=1 Tax=Candidatus Thiodiazotropha lotti TaxID=2792787 RepID=A0A9E4K6V6_9GAMM|nr:hypothetical protein [Candidatus Thiodiazotropha lotti]MCG7920871.1 hypothetical protein [Candidatus Thiodiazotropha lotti]MCG7930138.1 hypothetical protein [Candidatus Thiodiazotropha lotti]MCG7940836.1 hypothetical protein [Candidatus Thiodiazotropha lotti]MCG7989019.1 hypothetical protein [Candidatus Thiodiazotropha lotti]